MIYYVYIYLDTRKCGKYIYNDLEFDYEPFYVGRGKNNRYIKGCKCGGSLIKRNKINKIIKDGYEPKIIKLYEKLDYDSSVRLEIETISKIGRCDLNTGPLVNLTDGGEGTMNMSSEIKKKISEKRKGIKLTEKAKENMKKSKRKYFDAGNTTWNKGRHWSDDERLKLTNKSNLGKKLSEEQKKKLSEKAKKEILEGKSIIKLRSVLQYSLDDIFIKEHDSIISASIETNTNKSGICNCCRNISKSANGFKWIYKNITKL